MNELFKQAEARAAAGDSARPRDLAMLELFYSYPRDARLELAGLNDPIVDTVSDQSSCAAREKRSGSCRSDTPRGAAK